MSQQESMITRRVIHRVPGCDAIAVRRELEYRPTPAGALVFDLYEPARAPDAGLAPLVVVVEGYPDSGFKSVMGSRFKDIGSTESWARLIAASGMAAIAYTNEQPAADLRALLAHLRVHGAALGVDPNRVGLWTSSGHAPLALAMLMRDAPERIACAALCYPYTLDLDGASGIAAAAGRFGFANACAGRGIDDLARDVPLLLVRAGRDELPGLNEALDRFTARALAANLPLTLVNHPDAPHAFELFDGGAATAAVVEQVLAFLRARLYSAATTVNRG